MSDAIVFETDDEFTVVELTEQGPAGPSGSSVPASPTSLGGIIASGHFWITANGTLYLANQTSGGSWGNSTHVAHIEVDGQGRVVDAVPVLIQPAWSSVSGKPTFANVATSGLYSDLTGLPNLSVYLLSSTANATYQPLGNYVTPGCLTYSNISGTPNLSVYQTIATNTYANLSGAPNISLYLLASTAASTYYFANNPSGFITASALTTYAPLASPLLTGTPTAPTAANGTNTTQIATTAFVAAAISGYVTTSTANSTYAPITTTVTLTGVQTITNKTLNGATFTGSTTFQGDTDLSGYLLQHASVLPKTVSATAYTLTQADCGSTLVLTGTAAQTITVPTGLNRGYNVTIMQKSAFSSTIAPASGITLYAKNGLKTSGQNAIVGIVDIDGSSPPTGFAVGGDTTT